MMSDRTKSALVDTLLVGSVALLLAFFYVPIITLVVFSFTGSRMLTLPIETWSTEWYPALFAKGDFIPALKNSALIAAITTIFATVLGAAGPSPGSASASGCRPSSAPSPSRRCSFRSSCSAW
ncbi:ABC transporter permease [Segnochrobactrum spirostomi]|uniref:ABC transporter permease n=1 Tax=Segnochrobactrum spirostomi TaxID=2608987 RepID=UPI001FE79F2A|nr:hypothetical protein [Segnochrobactrum spirostomi]